MSSVPAVHVRRVTTRAELEDAWRLRHEVFVLEQGVPQDIEIDDLDTAATTTHLLVRDDTDRTVATGRLLLDGPGEVHIGRLAVARRHRGQGIGALLVAELCAIARLEHAGGTPPTVRAVLSAQEHAIGFYENLGFAVTDDERYLDAGIWHRLMARTLR